MNDQSKNRLKDKSVFCHKYGFLFLFLTVCAMIFILPWMNNEEFQRPSHSPFFRRVPSVKQSICAYRPISVKEALEEENILKSIAWPTTSSITSNYTLKHTSDPSCSKFTILPKVGGGQWYVGDQLEVSIIMKDYYCNPKTSGGDLLFASLKSKDLKAGVSGHVVDHLNGSYTAVFTLVWEGKANVEIIFVHPSEAILVLRRLNKENPDRVSFKSLFQSGSITETSKCNVCLRPTKQPVCNYTDVHTGEPWFCLKPKNLSCDTRIEHSKDDFLLKLRPKEYSLFKEKSNLNVPVRSVGSSHATAYQKSKDQPTVSSSSVFRPSGFYINGVWKSLSGFQVHQFDTPSIIQCLKGKWIHMYGDSTIRQWFEYLTKELPGLKKSKLYTPRIKGEGTGPWMSLDKQNNIRVTYDCHGPPLYYPSISVIHLHYFANELDNIEGGPDTVIALSLWAHFTAFPIEIYIRRLMSIRSAVMRLLARAPDTLVVIRGGNTRSFSISFCNSDWFSLQANRALKAVFKDMNVHLVDAWEMTQAHLLPHKLHPQPPIIKNMINVLLSYMCPQKHNK